MLQFFSLFCCSLKEFHILSLHRGRKMLWELLLVWFPINFSYMYFFISSFSQSKYFPYHFPLVFLLLLVSSDIFSWTNATQIWSNNYWVFIFVYFDSEKEMWNMENCKRYIECFGPQRKSSSNYTSLSKTHFSINLINT